MNRFKRCAPFKPFKLFNPLLDPPPRVRGRGRIGGSNELKPPQGFEQSAALERNEVVERLERFALSYKGASDAI